MNLTWYLILWFGSIFIITQLRLGYVLYKRRRTITTIAPTGTTGVIHQYTQGIHPIHAVEYFRRRGATAVPLHYNPDTGGYYYVMDEAASVDVNWGRDGF